MVIDAVVVKCLDERSSIVDKQFDELFFMHILDRQPFR